MNEYWFHVMNILQDTLKILIFLKISDFPFNYVKLMRLNTNKIVGGHQY